MLCTAVIAHAKQWWILGLMICINDGWQWRRDDEREENDMRQNESRSCQGKCGWWAADHSSNEAQPTFYLSTHYQLIILPSRILFFRAELCQEKWGNWIGADGSFDIFIKLFFNILWLWKSLTSCLVRIQIRCTLTDSSRACYKALTDLCGLPRSFVQWKKSVDQRSK